MPEKKPDQSDQSTFASRRQAREAREAAGEETPKREPRAFRAGVDVEQPVITVVRR